MLIDKSRGNWSNNDNIDYLDDIAFKLYLDYYEKEYNAYSGGQQEIFKKLRTEYTNHHLYIFYEQAKIIIRKEKLEKLNDYR